MKRLVVLASAAFAGLGSFLPAMAAAQGPATPPAGERPGMVWSSSALPAPAGLTWFGSAVAISDGTAMVGTLDDYGSVFVYRRTGAGWTQQQWLESSQPRDGGAFGSSIALRGSTAVIGESGWARTLAAAGAGTAPDRTGQVRDAAEPYAAYIYREEAGTWRQVARLLADDGGMGGPGSVSSTFAMTLAVDGGTVAVGAWGHGVDPERPEQGAVYVYSDGADGWQQVQRLTADDGRANDHFGTALALQGTTLLIGAKDATWRRDRPRQGAVYVYERIDGTWVQRQKLYADEARANAMFGQSLALDGDTALVGAPNGGEQDVNGAAYVLARANGLWLVGQKLTAQNGELLDSFGNKVALSGHRAVVGAHDAPADGVMQQGAAFVFEKVGDAWLPQARLLSPVGIPYSNFGYNVAIEGRTILANHLPDGHAYVFEGHRPATAQVAPQRVRAALAAGVSTTVQLQIANPGDETLDFDLAASAGARRIELQPPAMAAHPQPWPRAESAPTTLAQSPPRAPVRGASATTSGEALEFILDHGGYDNRLTFHWGSNEQAVLWLNRFAAPTGTGVFTIDSLSILFPVQDLGTLIGKQINLVAYYDADGDGDPRNAVRLGGDRFATVTAEDRFNVFATDFRVPGDGDVYVGFENSYARGGTWPVLYPAATDGSAPVFKRSWLASRTDGPPNLGDLADHVVEGFTENFVDIRGNWLIRATGAEPADDCLAPAAVPWLAIGAAAGSVPAGGSAAATLTFDASGLAEGSYGALLCVATNDPSRPMLRVPVSLTVQSAETIHRDGFESAP